MNVVPKLGGGFLSFCSVRPHENFRYFNKYKRLPDTVDSTNQFVWYKKSEDLNKDISFIYFENYKNMPTPQMTNKVGYRHHYQYSIYKHLRYDLIIPLVKKYFTPSKNIKNIVENITNKYNLSFDEICVLFYRGNDKIRESQLCSYDEYVQHADFVLKRNPNINFLIQSDETEFIEFMTKKYPERSFFFKDEIRHINKRNTTVDIVMRDKNPQFSQYFLAITIIMSKCKYVICGTGNCSIWIMFFRGNGNNTFSK